MNAMFCCIQVEPTHRKSSLRDPTIFGSMGETGGAQGPGNGRWGGDVSQEKHVPSRNSQALRFPSRPVTVLVDVVVLTNVLVRHQMWPGGS